MAVRQPDRFTPERVPRPGDTVVLRPTRRQRIGSALLKACCAGPLLLALPVASGRPQTIILVVAILSAFVAMGIDVLAQRDIWIKVSPTGLATRSGSIPWWAIDDIHVNDRSPVQTVLVRSFDTLEITLPAPRNGPTGSNPHFPDEVRLIVANWHRYSQVRPADPLNLKATLDRARALAEPENAAIDAPTPDVIDLRPSPAPAVAAVEAATVVRDETAPDGAGGPSSDGADLTGLTGTDDLPHVTDLLRPS